MRARPVAFVKSLLCLNIAAAAWADTDGSPHCDDLLGPVIEAIDDARLSEARAVALDQVRAHPDCERNIARSYVQAADPKLADEEYLQSVDAASSPAGFRRPLAKRDDAARCWDGTDNHEGASEAWDRCCSLMPQRTDAAAPATTVDPFATAGLIAGDDYCTDGGTRHRLCCEMFNGSPSHLRLPALRELAVNVRISPDNGGEEAYDLSLEQDGFLRSFDVSAILWPAGYLLTLCVAAPLRCGVPEVLRAAEFVVFHRHDTPPIAVELGSGIGAPSIALALNLRKVLFDDQTARSEATSRIQQPLVVATDRSPHSLALTIANKNANHAPIAVARADHTNATSLSNLRQRFFPSPHDDTEDGSSSSVGGGFAIVLGSSLQAFFDGSERADSALWKALDALLDPDNPDAVALLAHTKAVPVMPPPDDRTFRLARRISGDVFGMRTRAGASSDFEVSVFFRRHAVVGESRDEHEL